MHIVVILKRRGIPEVLSERGGIHKTAREPPLLVAEAVLDRSSWLKELWPSNYGCNPLDDVHSLDLETFIISNGQKDRNVAVLFWNCTNVGSMNTCLYKLLYDSEWRSAGSKATTRPSTHSRAEPVIFSRKDIEKQQWSTLHRWWAASQMPTIPCLRGIGTETSLR